ncbi:MAG: hypothetical protein HC821_04365, partial [Lewinella sp.]|nr:hypothetical protein [Lewinella sp.]
KRFNSREIPGAELEIKWSNHTFYCQSDAEGYFKIEQFFSEPLAFQPNEGLWQEATVTVVAIPRHGPIHFRIKVKVLMPQEAAFGVISDIDDTVLQSDVTSRLKLRTIWLTMVKMRAIAEHLLR